ncbi:LRR receptor-like serine/threonine-protein kinase GSO1 isoform X2 [Mangifera indica]|uniref:LRR receptor-like serine/threonine-protein kinase GSO1 isoform X2 n=1 Tax=Mangifera indica TaxID=29780 RepID=UPI001CFBF1B8|nr:LRR receptor-like serine/threonine-protein kinase GSO1 isoform X2 [Mangifera indica]
MILRLHGCFSSFLLSFLFLLYPLAFSVPSSDQIDTMIRLSQLFNSSAVGWDLTKQSNPCSWKGVNCSAGSLITELSLSGFGLSSSEFLSVVCNISSLQSLDVSENQLSSIPSEFITYCGKIGGLKLLNFSRNGLRGSLVSFIGFVELEFLDLSYNFLGGNISLLLDELVNLKSLNVSRNFFGGSIPSNLGKSKALEQLVLSVNNFTGEIPEEIADYGNLTLIDLSVNGLSGSIPRRIGELAKLKVLILSLNNLNGGIPTTLSSISTLSRFAANQNNFSGPIPSDLTKYLKNLDLSYNKLTGSIPEDLLSSANLQTVDLSNNSLEGSIPDKISPSMVRLRLGSNALNGLIPSLNFAALENLTYLELDNNSLTGTIPPQLGNCQNLALLNLAQNKLNGSLPAQLGNLSRLQVMKLQLNDLGGEIPVEFSQLKTLSQLNISWNSLTGSIPPSFSNLQQLRNLNLQGNHLNGSIPVSIGNMNSLIELQLGENQLSGPILKLPEKLQIGLNLSSNLFKGPIPDSLSSLTVLEVLDLSHNNFSVNITGNLDLRNGTEQNVPQKQAKGNKSAALPIIIAMVAAIVAVGVTIIALLISRRFYRVNDEHLQVEEELPIPQVIRGNLLTANGIHKSNISFPKAMEAVADPLNIVLKTRFSIYYKAIMPSGMTYVIKKLNWSDKIFQLGSHDKFEQELEVLGKLSNSNVMTPLAYVLTADSAYLFYEDAPKGTLSDVLHGSVGNSLDWASRYSIAVGVAQGLAFLHGLTSSPILLLDLSSRNIMLKSLKEPQVGDIELCKVIDPSKSTGSLSMVAGSVGYIPPEYAYTMRVTMAGNIYSFGVVLLELLTGKPAVCEGTELAKLVLRNSAQHDKWDHILDFSVSSTSLAVRSQMFAVLKVAIACVNVSPEARPKMKSVLRMLLNAR